GPVSSTNTVTAGATPTTDIDPSNNTNIMCTFGSTCVASPGSGTGLFTVPDAPVVTDVEPGNGQIGVQWKRGTNFTGGDSGGVIQYDIIVSQTSNPGSGTQTLFTYSGDTPTNTTDGTFSKIVPTPSNSSMNGKTFSVTVEARN